MRRIIHKYLPTVIATVLIMACVMGIIWLRFSDAKAWKSEASVAQVFVKKGDTLWDIATEYAPYTDLSVPEYVRQLKQMNHLGEDTIHAGCHLIVTYQAPEEL